MTETVQTIDYSVNLLKAVLWEYNDAVNLQAILTARQAWYTENQQQFWTDWEADVFNLATANSFGLAIWSILLGLPIYITAPSGAEKSWGFEQYHANFNRGNFSVGSNSTIQLPIEDARILLQLRAFQLQSCGCVPEINRELKYIFGSYAPMPGVPAAFVIDNHDMTCTYVFNYQVSNSLQYVMRYFDILPRPSGVKSTLVLEFSGDLVTEDGLSNYVTEDGLSKYITDPFIVSE